MVLLTMTKKKVVVIEAGNHLDARPGAGDSIGDSRGSPGELSVGSDAASASEPASLVVEPPPIVRAEPIYATPVTVIKKRVLSDKARKALDRGRLQRMRDEYGRQIANYTKLAKELDERLATLDPAGPTPEPRALKRTDMVIVDEPPARPTESQPPAPTPAPTPAPVRPPLRYAPASRAFKFA